MKSIIKFFIAVSCLLVSQLDTKAQYVDRTSIDTTANADTSLRGWNWTPDGVVGIEVYVAKFSGTGTGYAVLEGRIDSLTGWSPISTDTLKVLTATTGTYKKLWPTVPQYSNGYRVRYVTTGTQSSSVKVARLRRSKF